MTKNNFKSFDPKKFSRSKKISKILLPPYSNFMSEFCANCGSVFGAHYGIRCPIKKDKWDLSKRFPKPIKIK